MARDLKQIHDDLERLDRQIQATHYNQTMSQSEKRITLEGFDLSRQKLLKEEEEARNAAIGFRISDSAGTASVNIPVAEYMAYKELCGRVEKDNQKQEL